jgi:DNA-binding transcriptional MerR regulator
MLTIGEFSSATRLTVKALRVYHDEGLLVPERIDAVNGYRYYGDESFRKARIILILRDLGFSIREMKDILIRCSDDGELEDFFRHRLAEVESEVVRMQEVRGRIRVLLESGKEYTMRRDLEISERNVDEMWMCGIRYRGAYGDIGTCYAELFRKVGRFCIGKPFAIYYDCEYREDADIEAGIAVRKEVTVNGISCRRLSGGRFVSVVHRGSYDTLGIAYKALFEYLSGKGLKVVGPSREVYLKGPGMIFPRDPRNFATEIMVPV